MSKRNPHLPVSKAKTAYDLLRDIRDLILDNPKRYDQHYFLLDAAESEMFYGKIAVPACGTTACVAGWVVRLKSPDSSEESIPTIAQHILGIDTVQRSELFGAGKAGDRIDNSVTTLSMLRAHAKRGAAHIASFQKRYAAQLKAKRV